LTFALFACSSSPPPDSGLQPTVTPAQTEPPYNIISVPLDNLVDGQVVQVNGHTFVAGESILVAQCAHEVLAEGPEACDSSTVVTATVDAHGGFSRSFTVHRLITIGAERTRVDCGERPWRCNISGSAATDTKRAAGTGIAFDVASHDPPGSPGATR
jgi:hypothetical protein